MIPTPKIDILRYDAPIFTYSFPQLITKEKCQEFRNQFPRSNISNVHAWHSDYDSHKQSKIFQPVLDTVLLMCYDISKHYYNTPVQDPYCYEVDDLWLAMYEKNDNAIVHHHFPASFAACYYVDVEDDCSPITFGAHDELSIQPKNGMLLVWLALLPHRVAPTKKKRTCICMNISMKKYVKSSTDSIPIFN